MKELRALYTRVRERIPGANSFLKGGRSGFHFGASVAALRDSPKMKRTKKVSKNGSAGLKSTSI